MIVAVGSQNPIKIEATNLAFKLVFPHKSLEIIPCSLPTAVSAQPMSDQESIQGARHRALTSLTLTSEAKFGVGLESGLQLIDGQWFDSGWCVVCRHDGLEGIGSTGKIITPPSMVKLIKAGHELGEVIDLVFKTKNAKQASGHFGLMTDGLITRSKSYVDGIVLALSRFLHPELF